MNAPAATTPPPVQFFGIGVDAWQAIGSIATAVALLIAALAVVVAYLQLRQGRQTAKDQIQAAQQAALDQARPYVVLTVVPNSTTFTWLDLVLENVGAGPARDVRITVDPPLRRAQSTPGSELENARIFREPVQVLPPRYKVKAFLDSAVERNGPLGADLPDVHRVTIGYHDGHGHAWEEDSLLDLSLFKGLLFTEELTAHHAAKALREIRDLLKKSDLLRGPVEVTVETRADNVARTKAEGEARRQRIAHLEEAEAARNAARVIDQSGPNPEIA